MANEIVFEILFVTGLIISTVIIYIYAKLFKQRE